MSYRWSIRAGGANSHILPANHLTVEDEAPKMESLWSNLAWSILSMALDRSNSTSAVICYLSIASSILSVSRMFKVSVE